jgi:hypothetical protein
VFATTRGRPPKISIDLKDLQELAVDMQYFVDPIFVVTAEARRWGFTDAGSIELFNKERRKAAKFMSTSLPLRQQTTREAMT